MGRQTVERGEAWQDHIVGAGGESVVSFTVPDSDAYEYYISASKLPSGLSMGAYINDDTDNYYGWNGNTFPCPALVIFDSPGEFDINIAEGTFRRISDTVQCSGMWKCFDAGQQNSNWGVGAGASINPIPSITTISFVMFGGDGLKIPEDTIIRVRAK